MPSVVLSGSNRSDEYCFGNGGNGHSQMGYTHVPLCHTYAVVPAVGVIAGITGTEGTQTVKLVIQMFLCLTHRIALAVVDHVPAENTVTWLVAALPGARVQLQSVVS